MGSCAGFPAGKTCYYGFSNYNQLGEQLTTPWPTEWAECDTNTWLRVAASVGAGGNTCTSVREAYTGSSCCGADRSSAATYISETTSCEALSAEYRGGGCCSSD